MILIIHVLLIEPGLSLIFEGQERFTSMTRVYYRGAAACVIMFDLTSLQTFNSTIKWKKDLDSKCTLPNGKPIPCILVGNKVSTNFFF